MTRLALLVPLLLLVACGGGDDDDNGAGDAAVEQYEMAMRGQWARVWDELHPAHQALVDRDRYAECQRDENFSEREISVDETFEEAITVAELGKITTTAVTLRFDTGENAQFITSHLLEVDGEWKWFLPEDALLTFAAGECP